MPQPKPLTREEYQQMVLAQSRGQYASLIQSPPSWASNVICALTVSYRAIYSMMQHPGENAQSLKRKHAFIGDSIRAEFGTDASKFQVTKHSAQSLYAGEQLRFEVTMQCSVREQLLNQFEEVTEDATPSI